MFTQFIRHKILSHLLMIQSKFYVFHNLKDIYLNNFGKQLKINFYYIFQKS